MTLRFPKEGFAIHVHPLFHPDRVGGVEIENEITGTTLLLSLGDVCEGVRELVEGRLSNWLTGEGGLSVSGLTNKDTRASITVPIPVFIDMVKSLLTRSDLANDGPDPREELCKILAANVREDRMRKWWYPLAEWAAELTITDSPSLVYSPGGRRLAHPAPETYWG